MITDNDDDDDDDTAHKQWHCYNTLDLQNGDGKKPYTVDRITTL